MMRFSPENMIRGAESLSVVTMCSRGFERSLGRMARMSGSPDLPCESLRAATDRAGRLLVEIEHGPVVAARERAQPEVGVARGRMADHGQHRIVGERVGVRPRLR